MNVSFLSGLPVSLGIGFCTPLIIALSKYKYTIGVYIRLFNTKSFKAEEVPFTEPFKVTLTLKPP